jgi:hypothetical protein
MTPTPAATMTRMKADWDCPPWWLAGAWKPWVTRKATRDSQNMTLRTTAEPIPWVPRANPASDPVTPDWVRSR